MKASAHLSIVSSDLRLSSQALGLELSSDEALGLCQQPLAGHLDLCHALAKGCHLKVQHTQCGIQLHSWGVMYWKNPQPGVLCA